VRITFRVDEGLEAASIARGRLHSTTGRKIGEIEEVSHAQQSRQISCRHHGSWFITAGNAQAAGGSFTRGCAARDMQILMMIEQSQSTNGISTQNLNDAVLTMMHARMVCFEGNVPDALALYDDIARSLTSGWALSGQSRIR
jgi:hypothetical protein